MSLPALSRRHFLATGLAAAAAPRLLRAASPDPRAVRVTPIGKLVHECPVPGNTRADDAYPANPNGTRLSRHRFLIIYDTRGWRGTDEARSIAYQVRADSYTGRVLSEGVLAQTRDDWDVLGDGRKFLMSHGGPTVFGVPKGALIAGRPAAHANVFVAKWYKFARQFSAPNEVRSVRETTDLSARTMHVEWVQFRLNAAEDDLEIVMPRGPITPAGREQVPSGLPPPDLIALNQGFATAVPFNAAATEWVDMHTIKHEGRHPLAVFKYRFNPARGRYDWVETSPPLFDSRAYGEAQTQVVVAERPSEASIMRLPGGDWAICARSIQHPALWLRTADPFGRAPGKIYSEKNAERPTIIAPVMVFRCADGVIRLFTGDKEVSPYQKPRDPLYCWDVDPERGFAQTNRRIVFDGRKTIPEIRHEAYVMADMAKVLPHAGGRTQTIVHRVRSWSNDYAEPGKGPQLLPHEKIPQGIYAAQLEYPEAYPDAWSFA